jgi:hypothetical protein
MPFRRHGGTAGNPVGPGLAACARHTRTPRRGVKGVDAARTWPSPRHEGGRIDSRRGCSRSGPESLCRIPIVAWHARQPRTATACAAWTRCRGFATRCVVQSRRPGRHTSRRTDRRRRRTRSLFCSTNPRPLRWPAVLTGFRRARSACLFCVAQSFKWKQGVRYIITSVHVRQECLAQHRGVRPDDRRQNPSKVRGGQGPSSCEVVPENGLLHLLLIPDRALSGRRRLPRGRGMRPPAGLVRRSSASSWKGAATPLESLRAGLSSGRLGEKWDERYGLAAEERGVGACIGSRTVWPRMFVLSASRKCRR